MVVSVTLVFTLNEFIKNVLKKRVGLFFKKKFTQSDECVKHEIQGQRHYHAIYIHVWMYIYIYIYIYKSSIIDIEHYLIITQNLVHD